MLEAAEEHLVGERRLDGGLDEPCHRAGAHGLIVAILDQPLARLIRQLDRHIAIRQLRIKLHDELVDDLRHHFGRQMAEGHGRVQPVAELGREQLVDGLRIVALALGAGEAEGRFRHIRRASIRRHDEDDVAEIDLLAVVVGQFAVVHHLQQDVVEIGMRLLDLVEQQHAMRMLIDAIGQEPALVEADIAGRRADQAADGVPLHIFRHVEAQQFDAQHLGELLGDFGLADTGRTREQIAADRLLAIPQTGARELDRR